MTITIQGGVAAPYAIGKPLHCPRCWRPVRYITSYADAALGMPSHLVLGELLGDEPLDEDGMVAWVRHRCGGPSDG